MHVKEIAALVVVHAPRMLIMRSCMGWGRHTRLCKLLHAGPCQSWSWTSQVPAQVLSNCWGCTLATGLSGCAHTACSSWSAASFFLWAPTDHFGVALVHVCQNTSGVCKQRLPIQVIWHVLGAMRALCGWMPDCLIKLPCGNFLMQLPYESFLMEVNKYRSKVAHGKISYLQDWKWYSYEHSHSALFYCLVFHRSKVLMQLAMLRKSPPRTGGAGSSAIKMAFRECGSLVLTDNDFGCGRKAYCERCTQNQHWTNSFHFKTSIWLPLSNLALSWCLQPLLWGALVFNDLKRSSY